MSSFERLYDIDALEFLFGGVSEDDERLARHDYRLEHEEEMKDSEDMPVVARLSYDLSTGVITYVRVPQTQISIDRLVPIDF